jgi:hypothetical protein
MLVYNTIREEKPKNKLVQIMIVAVAATPR